jgi:hypothetical protein
MSIDWDKVKPRQDVDTTYADLRPSDLVIDKSGQAWPIADLAESDASPSNTFWLLDPVTKVKMHFMSKNIFDPVKVSRLHTQADEAAKLEAEFPAATNFSEMPDEVFNEVAHDMTGVELHEAVAAVEEIGGTVEAEVTAQDVDAAAAATEDSPLTLPPFADMTPLEQRSHLYLLHGVYGHDLVSKAELGALHDEAHATPPQSRFVPHSHE